MAQNVEATDLAISAKGAIYFTDATRKTVGYVDGNGQTRVVYSGGESRSRPASPSHPIRRCSVVTDAQSRFSWSFQIAADGSLLNGEPFYRLEMPEPDG